MAASSGHSSLLSPAKLALERKRTLQVRFPQSDGLGLMGSKLISVQTCAELSGVCQVAEFDLPDTEASIREWLDEIFKNMLN